MMDDWPRYDMRAQPIAGTGDHHRLVLYRRDDEAGSGPGIALYASGHEVLRIDLFGPSAHEHWSGLAGQPRLHYPYALDFHQHVELAVSNIAAHQVAAIAAAGVDVALDVDSLHEALRWAREQLLHPSTRVVIPCAGQGDRWHEYLGVRKHLVAIDGETLLDRLLRQLRGHGFREPLIIAPDAAAEAYERRRRAGLMAHTPDPAWLDADKFMSSRVHWNRDGRTLLLFGDVWFSDVAMARIADDVAPEFRVFGRPGPHPHVGKPWGEAFGMSFWPHHHKPIVAAAERLLDLYARHVTDGCSLWHLYRAMLGFPDDMMSRQLAGEHLLLINDWTHDFDLPEDYERWMAARRRA